MCNRCNCNRGCSRSCGGCGGWANQNSCNYLYEEELMEEEVMEMMHQRNCETRCIHDFCRCMRNIRCR